jgi:carboxylesterase type B
MQLTLRSLLVVPALVGAVLANWQIGDTVETTSGPVKGHASEWKPTVSEYLGIPYAVPPVGNLRWKKAQPYKGVGKTILADKFVSILQDIGV